MDAKQLRGKNIDELQELLVEQSKEFFNLRMQKGTGALTKPNLIADARKTIARIKTIIHEKSRGNQ